MFADHRIATFHAAREKVAIVVSPIQYVVNWPIQFVDNVATDLETHKSLLQENTELKAQLLLLHARVQKMLAIEHENKALSDLLQSSVNAGGKVLQAQILAVSPDPFLHQVVINKGSTSGVFLGQPVLDAFGIMGQVIQVGLVSSRVLLLTDSSSAIPVQDSRSGLRAIAVGDSGLDSLLLKDVTQTSNIKVGDLLITSGLGGRYPYGYPVGEVSKITLPPGAHFLQVLIKPAAHLQRSRLVLLVWPQQSAIDKTIRQGLTKAALQRKRAMQGEIE
jgi:rod shape-determining protein MreC